MPDSTCVCGHDKASHYLGYRYCFRRACAVDRELWIEIFRIPPDHEAEYTNSKCHAFEQVASAMYNG